MAISTMTRVLLADPNGSVREALGSVLEREQDIELAGETSDASGAVDLAADLKPDVLVLALDMPDVGGTEMVRQIAAALPGTKALVVSMHADSRFAVRALEAGAWGYMVKDRAYEELAQAIRAVVSNRTYVSPGIAGITRRE